MNRLPPHGILARWRRGGLGIGQVVAALVAASCLWASGCFCPVHAPKDVLDAGFRSPRQTFETFKTALDLDLQELEYRCFSQGFKERNGLSELTYREARDELFRGNPLIRLVARAQVREERRVGPRVHWIEAEVAGRTFRMRLVREDFYEIWSGDQRAADGWVRGELPVRLEQGDEPVAEVRIPIDPDQAQRLDLRSISEIRVGHEWKIDDVSDDTGVSS